MKSKKIIMYIIIIFLILFVLGIGILVINNNKKEKNDYIEEYTPEQEISDEQLRQTNINLYFKDSEKEELVAEIRKIDSKELLENPSKKLIEFLIEGPQNNNLSKIIPDNTKLISAEIVKGVLYIDFSEEFIKEENMGLDREKNIIDSILKTVIQLNEVKGIKILINGEEGKEFVDGEINFKEIFYDIY